jgi:polyhydroxyalkanoate synthesis regulator phasin
LSIWLYTAHRFGEQAIRKKRRTVMSLLSDYGEVDALLERIYKFRREVQHVEQEYLELRILLRDAEATLRADPEDGEILVKVSYLKKRLEDLERRHPWIASGKAREIGLWAPPAG